MATIGRTFSFKSHNLHENVIFQFLHENVLLHENVINRLKNCKILKFWRAYFTACLSHFFIILLFFMEWADGAASRRRRLAGWLAPGVRDWAAHQCARHHSFSPFFAPSFLLYLARIDSRAYPARVESEEKILPRSENFPKKIEMNKTRRKL